MKTFDTKRMIGIIQAQQGGPFKGGQRIGDGIAQVLNDLIPALRALEAYQSGLSADLRAEVGEAVVSAPEVDLDPILPPVETGARLVSGWKINTKTRKKERIEG
jgi:hypothetical protein